MISTRDLSELKGIPEIMGLMQSLALLDAILEEKPEFRYYSFDNYWSKNIHLGSMKNGSGDEYYAVYLPNGTFIKGFAHEAPMSPYGKDPPTVWKGIFDNLPEEFSNTLLDPALVMEDTTFCIWRTLHDNEWKHGEIEFPAGKDPDGSEDLLGFLDGKPETYWKWAEYYYGRKIDIEPINEIYSHKLLSNSIITKLNSKASIQKVYEDIKVIGYQ